jgi:uncharacterized damage-inducible protein DinB
MTGLMWSVESLADLFRHMEWADALTWKSVLASEGARTDAKLRERLYHLHVVQRAFLRMWRGEPRESPYPVFEDAPSLMRWGRAYYGEAASHLASLGDAGLSGPLRDPRAGVIEQRIGRPPREATIGESALQVVLHTNYHRGQINALLREVGGEPSTVDYIAWVWLGRPVAQWPLDTS